MKLEFKKAYCINLDHRKDRWEKSVIEFSKIKNIMDIELVRIDAVKNEKDPKTGLWDSFKKIINIGIQENLEYILCLEDDFLILDPNKIVESFSNVPDDFDFLSGGAYYLNQKVILNNGWMTADFCSSHFVVIRNTMYDKLLINSPTHIDRYISKLQKDVKLKAYIMHPMPVKQYSGFSDIRKGNVDYNAKQLPWSNIE